MGQSKPSYILLPHTYGRAGDGMVVGLWSRRHQYSDLQEFDCVPLLMSRVCLINCIEVIVFRICDNS